MFAYQLRKTIKLHDNLLNRRNISKLKAEHVFNIRLLHQLLNQEHFNATEIKDEKFPLRNNSSPTNIENPQFISCIHKPLSINLRVTDACNGDRKYLEKYPSVTTILSNTKPPNEFFGLMNWRKANIEKHGKEKFGLMQRDTTTKGTNFHQEMKEHFSTLNNSLVDTHKRSYTSGFFKSISNILPNISNPLAIESAVVHSRLEYAGTVDLVAEYMGTLSVIDWKTSKKKRDKLKDCHSYPLQLAAYAGSINYDNDYPFQISNGVLVIAYEDGETADVHVLDEDILQEYWEQWLQRFHKYTINNCTITDETIEDHNDITSGAPTDNGTNGPFLEQESKWTSKVQGANLAPNENGTKGPYLERSTNLAPNENGTKGPYLERSANLAPNGNGSTGPYFARRHYITNWKSVDGTAIKTVQNTGRNLSELGKRITDEEVVATWRTLSGLIETIFGKVLLSKGLLLSHYIKSIFSELIRVIRSSLFVNGRKKNE